MSSGIAPVPLEVAAKGQCTELDAGGARGVNSPSRWWPEVAEDLARVVALPGLAGILGRVLLVEGDEQVDQLAADGLDAQQVGQLGQVDQPLRVPGGPVVVGSVDDGDTRWCVSPASCSRSLICPSVSVMSASCQRLSRKWLRQPGSSPPLPARRRARWRCRS